MESQSSLNPWRSIWLKPKATMSELRRTENLNNADFFFFLGGTGSSLLNSMGTSYFGGWGLLSYLITIAAGGLMGLIVNNIFVAILTQTGKWLGGKGDLKIVKAAFGWSILPYVLLIPLSIVYISFDYFRPGKPNLQLITIKDFTFGLITFSQLSMTLIGLYIGVNTLAVAHKFHWLKSILNLLIATTIIASPFLFFFLGMQLITSR